MSVVFDPLVTWPLIWALAGVALLFLALALVKGLPGWALRGLSAAALLAALANPSLQTEERASLNDIVILIVDDSASQDLGGRQGQVTEAVARIEAEVAAMPGAELVILPELKHAIFIEATDQVLPHVRRFLLEQSGR